MGSFKYILSLLLILFISCSQEKVQESAQYLNTGVQAETVESMLRRDSLTAFQIDTFFTHRYLSGQFNGVVLFAEKGRLVYRNSFGYSDLNHHRQLNLNTKFQLASVSKQFTAFAVMLLYKRGLLNYSNEISKYFPGFPYPGITIRDLLTHRSGLPNYMYFSEKYWPERKKYMSNEDLLKMLIKYKPEAHFRPGQKFEYSNTGYALLALIVEKVSHKSFPEFLEKEIFGALGMENTFLLTRGRLRSDSALAIGYYSHKRIAEDSFMNGVYGDKGVISNAEDLLKWDRALYNGKLLGKKLLREAFVASDTSRHHRNYGYGWRILNPDSSEEIIYHGGLWKGFRTLFVRKMDEEKTIIVLSNIASNRIHMSELTAMF